MEFISTANQAIFGVLGIGTIAIGAILGAGFCAVTALLRNVTQ